MDELALLKDFRLEDTSAQAAREHARAALRVATARHRRQRRQGLILLAFVGAAILAGAAYAVINQLIVGSPAPPEVRAQPARFGHSAELIPVPHLDDPRLDEARVAAILNSTAGTVYLFSSPNAGGHCATTWIEGDRGYQGRLNMTTACGSGDQSLFAFGTETYAGKLVRLFFGHATRGVARVAIRLGEKTTDVPLTGRYFLAELPGPANQRPGAFISYSADGKILEQHSFPEPGGIGPRTQQPHALTEPHEVATINVRAGSDQVTLLVARASDGNYCMTVRSNRTPTNSSCATTPAKPREIGVSPMNFGGAPGGTLLLVGPVGSDVAALELRYQDGRRATVPLHDGWVLYEVVPPDYVEGRRPQVLIGRDASGRSIASLRLPWATPGG